MDSAILHLHPDVNRLKGASTHPNYSPAVAARFRTWGGLPMG